MSIGSTSKKVKLADGANTAAVDGQRRLQVNDPDLQVLVTLQLEQLRELKKITLILSEMSGVHLNDHDIDLPTY
jgi:hypothetical protein